MNRSSDSCSEMDDTGYMTHKDIERLLRGRIPVGDEDPELGRFLSDFENAYPEPSVDHCEAAHLAAIFAAAKQFAEADRPVLRVRGTKEDKMKRRPFRRLAGIAVGAVIVLAFGTTVAFAGPGVFTGSDPVAADETTTSVVAGDPTTETTIPTTDTTVPSTETTVPTTATTLPTTETTLPASTTTTTDEATDEAMTPTTHPDNFGSTISQMRHNGDHTPAAVVKGKTVPGYQKKHPTTTTAPTVTPTP